MNLKKCSKLSLDKDCPEEILALIQSAVKKDSVIVIYREVQFSEESELLSAYRYVFTDIFDSGGVLIEHFDMTLLELKGYLIMSKDRSLSWSSLGKAVQKAIKMRIKEEYTSYEEDLFP